MTCPACHAEKPNTKVEHWHHPACKLHKPMDPPGGEMLELCPACRGHGWLKKDAWERCDFCIGTAYRLRLRAGEHDPCIAYLQPPPDPAPKTRKRRR